MKLYQDFKIILQDNLVDFVNQLLEKIKSSNKWYINEKLQKERVDNLGGWKDYIHCVTVSRLKYESEYLDVNVWLAKKDNEFEIVNITPNSYSSLSPEQYNFIIFNFENDIIKPLKDSFKFEVIKSKEELCIVDYLGKEGEQALLLFSNFANKSTGHSHPLDFDRWCDFIFKAHRISGDKRLPVGYLEGWLLENGWPIDKAEELSLDYSYSMRLLDESDKQLNKCS